MQAINIATECLVVGKGREKELQGRGERVRVAGVKLTKTDREDILGGSIFLLLLAVSLFLSCFL